MGISQVDVKTHTTNRTAARVFGVLSLTGVAITQQQTPSCCCAMPRGCHCSCRELSCNFKARWPMGKACKGRFQLLVPNRLRKPHKSGSRKEVSRRLAKSDKLPKSWVFYRLQRLQTGILRWEPPFRLCACESTFCRIFHLTLILLR